MPKQIGENIVRARSGKKERKIFFGNTAVKSQTGMWGEGRLKRQQMISPGMVVCSPLFFGVALTIYDFCTAQLFFQEMYDTG